MDRYSIMGFFDEVLAVPLLDEVVRVRTIFSGAIIGDRGKIYDNLGSAVLSDVCITGESLSFTKTYERPAQHLAARLLDEDGNSPPIRYRFSRRRGSTWMGEYSTDSGHSGEVYCVLKKIPQNFPSFPLEGD